MSAEIADNFWRNHSKNFWGIPGRCFELILGKKNKLGGNSEGFYYTIFRGIPDPLSRELWIDFL